MLLLCGLCYWTATPLFLRLTVHDLYVVFNGKQDRNLVFQVVGRSLRCITMLQKVPRSFHSKSRHVRVNLAFSDKSTIHLCCCPTSRMLADLLTKLLGGKAYSLQSAALCLEGRVDIMLEVVQYISTAPVVHVVYIFHNRVNRFIKMMNCPAPLRSRTSQAVNRAGGRSSRY